MVCLLKRLAESGTRKEKRLVQKHKSTRRYNTRADKAPKAVQTQIQRIKDAWPVEYIDFALPVEMTEKWGSVIKKFIDEENRLDLDAVLILINYQMISSLSGTKTRFDQHYWFTSAINQAYQLYCDEEKNPDLEKARFPLNRLRCDKEVWAYY